MHRFRTCAHALFVYVIAAVLLSSAAVAQEIAGVQFHGFGGWYYGRSDNLQFIGAEKGGNAQNAQFALNVSAAPVDRIRISSQINLAEDTEGSKAQLDYAFVEFDVASQLKIRAGRAKHPWGIYGEIFDVGTARPFQHLSQAIYGPVGYTAKAYNGVGLTGTLNSSTDWPLQYDLYGGEIDAQYEESGIFSLIDPTKPATVPTTKFSIRSLNKDVIGTRLQLNTPVNGLWFGASAYASKVNLLGLKSSHARAYMGSVEYLNGPYLLRAEAANGRLTDQVDEHSGYIELAYKVTPKWQIAGRYDRLHRKLGSFEQLAASVGTVVPPFVDYRFDVDHTEEVIGLNYWVNPNVVLRVSYSKVEGPALLYPTPEQLLTYIYTGVRPADKANVIIVGTHFSF